MYNYKQVLLIKDTVHRKGKMTELTTTPNSTDRLNNPTPMELWVEIKTEALLQQ
jgi:hypothetical protein